MPMRIFEIKFYGRINVIDEMNEGKVDFLFPQRKNIHIHAKQTKKGYYATEDHFILLLLSLLEFKVI